MGNLLTAQSSTQPRHLGSYLVEAGLLSAKDLDRALEIQRKTREPLGRILVALGLLRRYDLYQALSSLWELPFVDLLKQPPDESLVRQFPLEAMIQERFVPLVQTEEGVEVATGLRPSGALEELVRRTLGPVHVSFRVTTEWDIDHTLRRIFREELLDGATYGLYFHSPEESAFTVFTRTQFFLMAAGLIGLVAGLYLSPYATLIVLNLLINLAFAASIWFKFFMSFAGAAAEAWEPVTAEEVAALKDDELPHYTILVPAYREDRVVELLLQNLARLDYPPEKIEILLLLEEDDGKTVETAKAARPPGNVYIVVVPNQIPKTKPKACNVGLFFARGDYLVIYDAEDRPEPDQLKKAIVAFRKGPPNLVCVQAALNYFNARDNFLSRMFTLEYSFWFDYMLPGLDRLGLPIPLGGTSNHFRTDILRELRGWDPFNVTEDADLGVRASARGYCVGVINSTTYEEANTRTGNWIRQRSRWIKGYMQTSLVNLRAPGRLVRRLGWRRALGFLLLVAGTPLTFLALLPMWGLYAVWLVTLTRAFDFLFPPVTLYVSLFNLLLGNGIAVYLSMLAVFKRKHYNLILWSLLNPFYWVLHSLAAWKALGQLFTHPFFWEKTVHGLSKELAPGPAGPGGALDSHGGHADPGASLSGRRVPTHR